jgi:S1-C subfamily serine protease
MRNVQVFASCVLSAALGFFVGRVTPSAVPSNAPRSTMVPVRDAIPAREISPRLAPSAEAVVRPLYHSPVAVESTAAAATISPPPPLPSANPRTPIHRGSLLSAFRFAGVGPHGGMKLGRVARGSLPELLGLRTGDEIVKLNGFRVADPQQALQAYARLPYVDDWIVTLRRGGAETEMRYALR